MGEYKFVHFRETMNVFGEKLKNRLDKISLLDWQVEVHVERWDSKVICQQGEWRWAIPDISVLDLSRVPFEVLLDQAVNFVLLAFINRFNHPEIK